MLGQPEDRNVGQLEAVKLDASESRMDSITKMRAIKSHGLVGLALTMGFVLMYLVDHLGNTVYCRACARPLFSVFQCFCCQRRSNDLVLRKFLVIYQNLTDFMTYIIRCSETPK